MFKIIEDYKDWKSAKHGTQIARNNLSWHVDSILKHINITKDINVIQNSPDPKQEPDKALEYMRNNSKIFYSFGCFYVLHDDPFESVKLLKNVGVRRCINNYEDGTMFEQYCKDCPHFQELVAYHSMKKQLFQAQEKEQKAKQKLLNDFMFWKKSRIK